MAQLELGANWARVPARVTGTLRSARLRWRHSRMAGPRLLQAFAELEPRARFVEIGANDGEQHDHLRPLILTHEWRGVMVEPVPFVFERLRRNYETIGRVALERAAIADRDGARPFYHLAPVADPASEGLPQWYDGIGSFSREAVLDHRRLIPDIEARLVSTQVPCLTLDTLCAKHGLDQLDLLLVDTEGYDHEILRHVDFRRHRPAIVVYEHYHLTREQREDTLRRVREAGYQIKEEGFDTWCVREDAPPALQRRWRALRPQFPGLSAQDEPR